MTEPVVGVVVVAYLSGEVIGALLDSIPASSDLPIMTIVVDNSPADDGTADIVSSRPGVRLIPTPHNPGYGAGMNIGAAALPQSVKWIVIANPDLVISPGAIDALIAAAERLPRAALLGPLVRNSDGSVYPSARKLPSLRTGIGHAIFVRVWPGNPWTASYRNDLATITERRVGWLSGSFLLVRRDAFDQVGGFDDGYFMYFEDVDLARNLDLAGWRVYFTPSAEVVHFGALSTKLAARAMIRAHHRSAYRYLAKRYHAWYLWPVRITLRAGLAMRSRFAKG